MPTIPVWQARLNNVLSLENTSAGVGDAPVNYATITRTNWQDLGETVDSYSILGWVKFRDLSAGSVVVGTNANNGATSYPFKIDTNASRLRFTIYDGTNAPNVSSDTPLELDTWYHFACIRSVADDKLYLYLNATVDKEAADTTVGTCKNTKQMGIGYDGGLTNAGNILVSDIRVFNRVLTDPEITDIYENGLLDADGANPSDYLTSLEGWWKFNKFSKDYSANEHDAVITASDYSVDFPVVYPSVSRTQVSSNSRFILFNMPPNSVAFDNNYTNSYLTVSYNSVLNVGTGDFTVLGWSFSRKTVSDNSTILYRYNSGTSQGFAVLYSPEGKLVFQFYNGGGSITTDLKYHGKWINFVVVRRSGVPYIYVNGALVKTGTSAPGNLDGVSNLFMGRDVGNTKKLCGNLKDIRYYGRALSAAEIFDLFAGVEPAATNLIGWWKMSEGTGNALDYSGNNLSAVFSGAQWSQDVPVAQRSSV